MKIYDESLYCQECGQEISTQESVFNGNCCNECSFSIDAKVNEMGQVIEQGPYYRVVERNGKYYPEYQDFRGSDDWKPMEEADGSVACFDSMEDVEKYWQRREF